MPRFATLDQEETMSAVLKVVGVGGGGCNAIESMIKRGLTGVEYVAVNTDNQALLKSSATRKIQIGKNITRGLGAGADPNVGHQAAEEDRENLTKVLEGSDMVFVTAGMGGGTGTGAAPLVASIAKSLGALVIGIVTKPFRWEGKRRTLNAEQGIHDLKQYVDSLISIPNERLLTMLDSQTSANKAFDIPNEVLYEATSGIADIITINGIINVDFADVKSVMNESGVALMGCGLSSGENRAIEAAQKAISSPLLEGININGAKNILLNVTGSESLTMQEIDEGNRVIYEAAGEEANVIFGWVNKPEMNEYVSYTVIATGFDSNSEEKPVSNVIKTPVIEQRKKEDPKIRSEFTGGFTLGGMKIDSQDDLDKPTIFRVKKSKANLLDEFNIPQSGFSVRNKEEEIIEEETNKHKASKEDDDNSSSFLRMMMD
ncbi:MAG: cell division protein FtsZ [Melioribacteraceae bacterium]|nr:cell division protein FtsZ [Melioribacteraceae bacterium]